MSEWGGGWELGVEPTIPSHPPAPVSEKGRPAVPGWMAEARPKLHTKEAVLSWEGRMRTLLDEVKTSVRGSSRCVRGVLGGNAGGEDQAKCWRNRECICSLESQQPRKVQGVNEPRGGWGTPGNSK